MNFALLTAAGSGTRTNQDIPKQFIHINNKPILIYTLEAFQKHPSIDAICVAILPGWEEILKAYAKQFNITKLKYIVYGGATGQESIYNGLKKIKEHSKDNMDIILVHDGNRPLVSQDIITDSLVTLKKHGSAIAAIPCTEVVFVVKDDEEESQNMIERNNLRRTQTPHAYFVNELWDAYNLAIKKGILNMAASCSLMATLGKKSYFSKGSEKNIKITTMEDIEIFKALLNAKNDDWIK